jgi:DNA-binding transcriptional regulator of glucitol operon
MLIERKVGAMEHIFLIVGAAWAVQFLLSYWQLRRFHGHLAQLRKLGRCSVGMCGDRWRGRTYAILVVDEHNQVRHAASFSGWTVFSSPRPVAGLDGMRLGALLSAQTPLAHLRRSQWQALQQAAQFLETAATPAMRAA